MKILYEDEAVIVIHKESGEPVQSAQIGAADCVSMLKNHLAKAQTTQKGEPYLGVVHRLDQPVAGLLVFGKSEKAAAALSAQLNDKRMSKRYHAVVEGIVPDEGPIRLVDMIYKDASKSKAAVGERADAKKAELVYKVESVNHEDNTSILDIELITGRFHQIRAQLSHAGYPILGDGKYGSSRRHEDNIRGGIALTADRLEFVHPVSGRKSLYTIEY